MHIVTVILLIYVYFFSIFECQGVKKKQCYFLFCKEQKTNCVFLQETHSDLNDEKFWKIQWSDLALFAHGSSHLAGVMLLFNRFEGSVIVHKGDTEGHWLMVDVEINDTLYIIMYLRL